jgi:hypothetical protein
MFYLIYDSYFDFTDLVQPTTTVETKSQKMEPENEGKPTNNALQEESVEKVSSNDKNQSEPISLKNIKFVIPENIEKLGRKTLGVRPTNILNKSDVISPLSKSNNSIRFNTLEVDQIEGVQSNFSTENTPKGLAKEDVKNLYYSLPRKTHFTKTIRTLSDVSKELNNKKIPKISETRIISGPFFVYDIPKSGYSEFVEPNFLKAKSFLNEKQKCFNEEETVPMKPILKVLSIILGPFFVYDIPKPGYSEFVEPNFLKAKSFLNEKQKCFDEEETVPMKPILKVLSKVSLVENEQTKENEVKKETEEIEDSDHKKEFEVKKESEESEDRQEKKESEEKKDSKQNEGSEEKKEIEEKIPIVENLKIDQQESSENFFVTEENKAQSKISVDKLLTESSLINLKSQNNPFDERSAEGINNCKSARESFRSVKNKLSSSKRVERVETEQDEKKDVSIIIENMVTMPPHTQSKHDNLEHKTEGGCCGNGSKCIIY